MNEIFYVQQNTYLEVLMFVVNVIFWKVAAFKYIISSAKFYYLHVFF